MEKGVETVKRVRKLTHPDPQRPGYPYERPDEVERQIEEALRLDPQTLIQRSNLQDKTSPDYFREECLVYLLRESFRENRDDLVNTLYDALIRRCAKNIHSKARSLLRTVYANDFFADTIEAVFSPIFDLNSDDGDFAQKCFGVYLKYKMNHVLRRYMIRQRNDLKTDSLDEKFNGRNVKDSPRVPHVAEESLINQEEVKRALSAVPWEHRVAYLMRHCGWEIENKDPDELTISKYFKVSARTVRRWLAAAEEHFKSRVRR